MTPVFGHGALRLYLLSLLAEAPRHGYELMQALEHRFGGTYSPSAGTIYPRLAKLEEEGLVTKTADGRRTTYEITDTGRAELRGREGELHALEGEITDSVRRMAADVRAGVKSAMEALRADLAVAERDARASARASAPGTSTPGAPSAPSAPRSPAAGRGSTSAPPRPGAPDSTDEATQAWLDAAAHADDVWPRRSEGATASHTSAKAAARMAVHDVDLALSDFRQQVREAARRERGEHMTSERAAAVRRELEAALLRIKSALGG
ncbi:DNA-binding transcriptional regulator, PadR family [Agrococcus baldri]|uniref:DNA-binding transcriptional regulator, PadR family n=1 Tax=Agrococcus baldri TaxID=153730 RepID=A0AA94KYT5_9MICO|nr:DNA-binding transcriptional regulator, PadR family [Agrococcus baldri]